MFRRASVFTNQVWFSSDDELNPETLLNLAPLNPTGAQNLASGLCPRLCPSVLDELGLRIWAERSEFKVFRLWGSGLGFRVQGSGIHGFRVLSRGRGEQQQARCKQKGLACRRAFGEGLMQQQP